jgi:hypothetical protein
VNNKESEGRHKLRKRTSTSVRRNMKIMKRRERQEERKKKKRATFSILAKSKGKHFAFVAFKVYQ